MGREVRMVPPTWEHPKNERGNYIPLHADYPGACVFWCDLFYKERPYRTETSMAAALEYLAEDLPPKRENFMPVFEPGTATHYCMYETTTEGTPISPVCATPEELAQWLAANGASSFADQEASYEQWLNIIKIGSAPSAVWSPGSGLQSGVAAMSEDAP